jgi:hypothetical protein
VYYLSIGLRSSTIIFLNLIEFEKVIVIYHLWDPLDRIKMELPSYLSSQVGLISSLSQSLVQILLNSDK